MNTTDLQSYLHDHIPLTAAMEITVEEATEEVVTLAVPLGPNVNHRHTMFGGSLSSLGITAAWALLHLRLRAAGFTGRLVVQQSTTDFLAPATVTARATARLADDADWERFLNVLERRGKARIGTRSEIACGTLVVAVTEGTYVALAEG